MFDDLVPVENYTNNMKNFIGSTFLTPKGGVLTVTKVLGMRKGSTKHGGSHAKFGLHCSICSLDTELWNEDSINAFKINLKRGSIPCGCSHPTHWTEEQYTILTERVCAKLGYEFLGFTYGFKGGSSKLKLRFNETGEICKDTNIKPFINGTSEGAIKGALSLRDSLSLSVEDLVSRYRGKYILPEGASFTREGTTLLMDCEICNADEYPHRIFKTTVGSFLSGNLPCRCNGNYIYTLEDKKYLCKKYVEALGGNCMNLALLKDMRVDSTEVFWTCREGHEVVSKLGILMNGSGCRHCAKGSFKTKQPATFYIVRWYGFCESYLKYGITNLTVMDRVKEQSSKASLDYEILYEFHNKDGQLILDVENSVKSLYGREGVCPKRWLPSGYTETVEDTENNLQLLLSLASVLK